jgi:hypothetical protein
MEPGFRALGYPAGTRTINLDKHIFLALLVPGSCHMASAYYTITQLGLSWNRRLADVPSSYGGYTRYKQ